MSFVPFLLSSIFVFTSLAANAGDKPLPDSFFGLHIHRVANRSDWPLQPFGSLRLWDAGVSWRDLEPAPGEWQFAKLDKAVSLAEERGIEVMLTLGNTPRWASARPDERCSYGFGCAAEPWDTALWEAYVRKVVTRYQGRIKLYEIWNEVHFAEHGNVYDQSGRAYFYSGSAKKLVELARVAYRVIREVDQGAKIASPSMHVYGDWIKKLDLYLEEGGNEVTDVVSFHFYLAPPERALEVIGAVRAQMEKHGIEKAELWNTESGFVVDASSEGGAPEALNILKVTESRAAAYLVRAMVLDASTGVNRVFWYAWDNDLMSMRKGKVNKPNLVGDSYARVRSWLLGTSVEACAVDRQGAWSCALTRSGRHAWIVWSPLGNRAWQAPPGQRPAESESLSGLRSTITAGRPIPIGSSPIIVKLDSTSW